MCTPSMAPENLRPPTDGRPVTLTDRMRSKSLGSTHSSSRGGFGASGNAVLGAGASAVGNNATAVGRSASASNDCATAIGASALITTMIAGAYPPSQAVLIWEAEAAIAGATAGIFFGVFFLLGYLLYSTMCAALGAMVGLARRVEQGGSWLVRVSLVQVAHWIAGLGTVDAAQGARELAESELANLLMESDGPLGRLRHLKPAIGFSETPARYARPPEPLGTSPARCSPTTRASSARP